MFLSSLFLGGNQGSPAEAECQRQRGKALAGDRKTLLLDFKRRKKRKNTNDEEKLWHVTPEKISF